MWEHYCPTCQRAPVKSSADRLSRQCKGPPTGPPLIEKIGNFATAEAKWMAAGMPTRTPERVQEILVQHCTPCQYFNGEICRLCGCPVNRAKNFRNKLHLATEGCPDKPPKWLPESDSVIAANVVE